MQIKKLFYSLSNLQRIILIGASILFVLTAGIKAGLFIDSATHLVAAKGGEFREGIIGQPAFINPIIPLTSADRELSKLIFGSLHDIAESITHSEDGKTWNVRLLQDVAWQDGKPVTSDDVIFTMTVLLDKDNQSPLFNSFQGVTAERLSELEVKFNLQSPYALFAEENLKNLGVIPKHIFEDAEIKNAIRFSIYGLQPVGFGPYRVDSYDKDERGVISAFYLTANKRYFRGEPYVSRLTIKFYRNENELISAYKSARIDGFTLGNAEGLLSLGEGGASLNLAVRHNLYDLSHTGYYALFLNQIAENKSIRDIKIRRALTQSADIASITKNVFQEYAFPLYGPTLMTDRETAAPASSETIASALNGVKLEITLPDQNFLVKTAEELKRAWEEQGAEIKLNILTLDKIQEVIKNRDYEAILFGNITGTSGDLFSFWHSSQRFYPGNNLSLYQNRKVDALIESFGRDFDAGHRTETLKQISDLVSADQPAVFLYAPQYIYITVPSLRGVDENMKIAVPYDRFSNVHEWYLRTDRVFK